ncbi:MAG: Ig-like domain-containing protein, partial [Candidatus Kerfeldbacteria bacterium]|nr:Ig-like domain-containing protein [Candidatus Kerfeldbacteria bacterium]
MVQGNLGSASINGTVNNSSGTGVSGATVWIDGTQFSATTGQDGTFSFSNVGPSGGVQIKAAKESYMDQSISTYLPTSGLVSLGAITLYSGTMGQGGDYTMPRVASSFPQSGMMGFPTQSPSGGVPTMDITFSKAMDTTTIVDTDASDAGSNIYLTEAGSSTKMGGSVAMISGSTTQARFTPTATLTAGRNYTLFITPGVKDTAGNPVSGNGPGGAYVLSFGTTGQMFSAPGEITNFGTGNAFPPFVIGSQPAPGKVNVATNSKAFVTFSDSLQNTTANLANVKLYQVVSPYTASEAKTLVSTTNSLDASQKIVILTPTTLSASANYRIDVTGGLASSKGITLGNPGTSGYATQVMYKSDFQTGANPDSSAPTISGTIPADSATGVSTIKPIVISFSEAMDPSTITETSVSLKLGSTVVAGNLTYDPNSRTATLVPGYALTASSTYTIYVLGGSTGVKDLAGVALATTLQQTFTTGSADTTAPLVTSAQANDFALKVSFSRPMLAVTASDINYAYSVLKKENYVVRRVNGTTGATLATITLPDAATLSYDATSRSVAINGVSGLASGDYANIVVSNVKDIGYNNLDIAGNAATTTAQSSAKTGGFNFGPGMGPMMDASGQMMHGGMMGGPPPMVGTFVDSGIGFAPGVKVYPFNTMAGVSTIYGVEIPISYQIPNAGFIDITFPEGTDVTNAKKDTESPPNTDLNGPGPGTVVFGTAEGTLPTGWTTGGASSDGVIIDATSRKVRVILGAVATRRGEANLTSGSGDQHDFIRLDIAQVVNSTLSTGIDTSGSSATVETKNSDGTVLETLSSGSFFTSAAGAYTLRGHATTATTGINGINVFLMSPMTGPMSSSSAANRYGATNGEFMFQNLLAGTYM